jgi:hypothetical protein
MPTKRPDQLPEGSNFNLDDILLIEKSPDSNAKQLLKTTVREFMSSATQFDPQNVGQNSIVGFQSKFEWMVAQMEKLQTNPAAGITPYEEFESAAKAQETAAVTPSPTPSITPTVTPSVTPNLPPVPTPTPSPTPFPIESQLTINGATTTKIFLPSSYLPKNRGYNSWTIKSGTHTNDLSPNFFGFFPDSFSPSGLQERLSLLRKVMNEDSISIDTVIASAAPASSPFGGVIETSQGGLRSGSTITLTIKYS